MKPLMVQVITYAPTQFYHCQHCEVVFEHAAVPGVRKAHQDILETSIPPDLMRDYRSLSDWIIGSVERYGGRVVFKVIDAASIEGVVKSLRYGVRKYPAVILDQNQKQIGTDFARADTMIEQRLAAAL